MNDSADARYVRDWSKIDFSKIPLYNPSEPPIRLDHLSFDDELEVVWGRKWGSASKIGKVHTVLVSRPGSEEINTLTAEHIKYFLYCGKHGVPGFGYAEGPEDLPNLKLMREQHDAYCQVLKDNGLEIIYANFPDGMTGAYLPYRGAGYPAPFMLRNGCVIGRSALAWKRGQEAIWTKKIAEIGVPILYTVHGTGIFEGRIDWVDPSIALLNVGHRANMEGFRQMEWILKQNGVKEVIPVMLPCRVLTHLDCVFTMVAPRLALIHSPVLPYELVKTLQDRGLRFIDVPLEDMGKGIINCFALEPGRIIAPTGATKTIAALRKAGVDVIEVNISESLKLGAGPDCLTVSLIREEGPYLDGR